MFVRLAETDIARAINPDCGMNDFHALVQFEADTVACPLR